MSAPWARKQPSATAWRIAWLKDGGLHIEDHHSETAARLRLRELRIEASFNSARMQIPNLDPYQVDGIEWHEEKPA